jgi:hypothetical protein
MEFGVGEDRKAQIHDALDAVRPLGGEKFEA